jgi:hypothetical protein
MVAQVGASLPEGDHFGMGGGIAVGEIAIPSSPDHLAVTDDHCSHRDFSYLQRALRATKGFLHVEFVVGPYR